jgi:transcriptional regulator with XRE-family HTH domain
MRVMTMTNQIEATVLDELAHAVDAREGTRADFAKAVGIGQAYLSQILSGKRPLARLPMGTVRKISEISGIPIARLAAVSEPAE